MSTDKNKSGVLKGRWYFAVLILTFGLSVGFFLGRALSVKAQRAAGVSVRVKDDAYQFISPLLLSADGPIDSTQLEYKVLKSKITEYINREVASGDHVSVYFRDLNKAQWIGIDQDTQYNPASLLKVMVMMGYFKKAEEDPGILSKKIVYAPELLKTLDSVAFAAPTELVSGRSYTIEDLINKMIVHSDNGAKDMLYLNIDPVYLEQMYTELGMSNPDQAAGYTISAQSYSMFFRLLYNATYLNREYSNKALDVLSKATFDEGLRQGVPADVPIAHKFGEYVNGSAGKFTNYQLHDCGIVYAAIRPYFLCVMTEGSTAEIDSKYIGDISTLVYKNFALK